VKIGAVTSEFKRANIENLPQLGCNLTIIVHLARWHSETDWNIKILISARQSAIISVHLVKIGWILISDPRVLCERSCTAGVDNRYHA